MGDPFQRLRGRPLVVHLYSGRALAGTVYGSWRGVLELRGALELEGGRAVSLDGAACVPHTSIDYFQAVDTLPEPATQRMAAVG